MAMTHAESVRSNIRKLAAQNEKNNMRLAQLLSEVKREKYWQLWGFKSFVDYVENGDLGTGWRQAYDLVKVHDKSGELGIPESDIVRVKPTKLREIFRLDTKKHADEIKKLVGDGVTDELTTVKDKVNAILSGKSADAKPASKSFSFDVPADQLSVVEQAIQHAMSAGAKTRLAAFIQICQSYNAALPVRAAA